MVAPLSLKGKCYDISMEREVTKLDLSIPSQFEHYPFPKLNGIMCHQFILNGTSSEFSCIIICLFYTVTPIFLYQLMDGRPTPTFLSKALCYLHTITTVKEKTSPSSHLYTAPSFLFPLKCESNSFALGGKSKIFLEEHS